MENEEELKFSVEKLGCIQKGEFTQKPLTIFCGPNNSGKTWSMYALYFFHYLLILAKEYAEEKKENNPALSGFNDRLSNRLTEVFNSESDNLKKARFSFDVEAEYFNHLLEKTQSNPFLIPAERSGLHLFFRELRTRRTALLHHASKKNIDINELLKDVIRSRYAYPIANYIDWLNEIDETRKKKSDFYDFAQQLQKKLVGGAYKVDAKTGTITFKPYQKKRDGISTEHMSLHLTSSTVKSLFGLWFYLQHQAKKGDVLMIDEPELNIHPENQRKIARLLAQLVNAGLRVVISTHSDYIVREFNSLIMLHQDKEGVLRTQHEYTQEEVLRADWVGAYLFDERTIKPFDISPEDGIYATTFDQVIEKINKVNNDIYYTLQEAQNDEKKDG